MFSLMGLMAAEPSNLCRWASTRLSRVSAIGFTLAWSPTNAPPSAKIIFVFLNLISVSLDVTSKNSKSLKYQCYIFLRAPLKIRVKSNVDRIFKNNENDRRTGRESVRLPLFGMFSCGRNFRSKHQRCIKIPNLPFPRQSLLFISFAECLYDNIINTISQKIIFRGKTSGFGGCAQSSFRLKI